eukprot:s1876_g6.t1
MAIFPVSPPSHGGGAWEAAAFQKRSPDNARACKRKGLGVAFGSDSTYSMVSRSSCDGEKSIKISQSREDEASALESRGALLVDEGSVVGWRAKLPRYTIPEEREAPDPPGEGAEGSLAVKTRERKHISGSDSPFVLLPDIIFQLLDNKKDKGTLCVHLPAKYGLLQQAERSVIRKAIRTRKIVKNWDREGPGRYLKLECGDMVEVLQHDIQTGMDMELDWKPSYLDDTIREPVEGDGYSGWFPDWAVDPASEKSWVELAAEDGSGTNLSYGCPRNLTRLDVLADSGDRIKGKGRSPHSVRKTLRLGNVVRAVLWQDACDFYVDIFASKAGRIKWNPKLQLGRCLLQQHLFSITSEDDDEKAPDVYFFNPADTLFDDPLRKDEPFDNRFCPSFRCATESRTLEGTTTKITIRSTTELKPLLVAWNAKEERCSDGHNDLCRYVIFIHYH